MAEVPQDYVSDPDEVEKRLFKGRKAPKLRKLREDAKPDSTAVEGFELPSDTDQEPQLKTKEDSFEEGKPGNAENVLLQLTGMPEKEIPKLDSPIQTNPEVPPVLKLGTPGEQGEEDLEVSVDEKHEEPDRQPPEKANPDVSMGVLIKPATGTDEQLPTETKSEVPGASSSETRLEVLEETTGKIPGQPLREQHEEIGLEQTTPGFPSEKPRKVVETNLLQQKMTTSVITEEIEKDSTEEKSTEQPSKMTKPEFPNQKPRKSIEEAVLKPPERTKSEILEEMRLKSTRETGAEPPEQIKSEFPDKKARESTEEKAPEPLEEIKPGLPEEESKKPVDRTSLERSEQTTSEVPQDTHKKSFEEKVPEIQEETDLGLLQEIKPDVQEETQRKSIEEKVQEPSEDSKPTDQKEKQRKTSEKFKLEETGNSTKEKGLELQELIKSEFPKKELRKTTNETGQVPPQMTKSEVQEKSQTQPTEKRNLESSDEPKPTERHTELSKEDRPEPSKLKYPVRKDEQVHPDYRAKKFSVKGTNKAKKECVIGSPRESIESIATDFDSQELLKVIQSYDFDEEFSNLLISEPQVELGELNSEKKDVGLSQVLEKLEPKDRESNTRNVNLEFEHLKWSPEKVAEWISQLGFPQYKECFIANFINGQKLIHVNCSNLPQMGITDFEDMKTISRHTRELLSIEEPSFSRSIRLPHRDNIGLFLEQKGDFMMQLP
ncbi:sterile alpha motif domain-containing protein 15 isoform X2 [Nannospalax galili]|uniref:sterile alpha motif domain-containing protein 15 isoform X2 n=1 Tax=Nannospalax galili TaxID=1026970 RepID=UPI00111C79D9|nr:sterile alpha motif domain-containing protein 15 isoform X2 [Nannospalax galili]